MTWSTDVSSRAETKSEPTILVDCKADLNGLDFYNYCHDWARRLHKFLDGGVSIKIRHIRYYLCEFRWKGKFIAIIFEERGLYPPGPGFYTAESYVCPVSFRFKPDEVWEGALKLSVQRHIQKDIKSLKLLNKKVLTEKP